jgi:hypothetical protein
MRHVAFCLIDGSPWPIAVLCSESCLLSCANGFLRFLSREWGGGGVSAHCVMPYPMVRLRTACLKLEGPLALPCPQYISNPGSLYSGLSQRTMAWILLSTCKMVDTSGCHSSPLTPLSHVPRSDRHTALKSGACCLQRQLLLTFSIQVQIRIEALKTASRLSERYFRRYTRILARAEEVKLEKTVFVRRTLRPNYEASSFCQDFFSTFLCSGTYFIMSGRDMACFI